MPAYYFALEGYHHGDQPDPASDALIAIQYQKIDLTTGEPLEKLTILPVWESSEKEVVTGFYHRFFRPDLPVTQFIPVGMNLDYAYEMLLALFRKHQLPVPSSRDLYYRRPRFDLAPVIVLLNNGRFAGASPDRFSAKKSSAGRINAWYAKAEFKKIGQTLREEAENYLRLLQYLSKYKTRLGIARKGGAVSRDDEYLPSVPRVTTPAPRRKSPAPEGKTLEKRAPAGAPVPGKRPAPLAKAPQPSPGKSPDGPKSAGRISSVSLSRFRKHTPSKKHAGKRD